MKLREVISVKAIGNAIKLTLEGPNQVFYFQTWIFTMVAITCIIVQLNYLNMGFFERIIKDGETPEVGQVRGQEKGQSWWLSRRRRRLASGSRGVKGHDRERGEGPQVSAVPDIVVGVALEVALEGGCCGGSQVAVARGYGVRRRDRERGRYSLLPYLKTRSRQDATSLHIFLRWADILNPSLRSRSQTLPRVNREVRQKYFKFVDSNVRDWICARETSYGVLRPCR
ncbi:hypothetical protein Fmac_032383 [Flemingia macrophylla]|uniref:Probable magnesium transporter n=1 Tax=Flemingia macrophylla TaxID=520843 RepID=A0ABD1L4T2_9FABA